MPELQPGVGPLNERMRLIRFRMARESFRFSDEVRLIPRWLVYVVATLFVIAQVAVQLIHVFGGPSGLPPRWAPLALFGFVTAGAIPVACLIFLFAYINVDARRRGMSPWFWTLVAICVPYLIGVIIYFVLREPLAFSCPQCGARVTARFNYCPNCSCHLRPTCPQCKHEVGDADRYCPFCAQPLAAPQ